MDIDIDDLQPEWNYINNLRKLRNIIVHHNGQIKPDHSDYKSFKNFSNDRFELTGGTNSKSYLIEIKNKEFLLEIPDVIFRLLQSIGKCEEKNLKLTDK